MANDMMDTLKGLLGDNADEKIQSVLSSLQSGSGGQQSGSNDNSGSDSMMQASSSSGTQDPYISQIKNLVSQLGGANDSRSNLLLSLKPYMRAERQKSIDSAVKILNLTRISGFFK